MTAPPRFLEQLLASLGATPAFREPLLGDLAEEFALRAARDGTQAARGWYRREALRSAPHLLHDGVRHLRARDLVHLAGVVLSAWVLLATVVLLVALPLASAALRAMGVDVASLLTFDAGRMRWLPWQSPALAAAALTLGLLMAAAGGRIAGALHGRAPLVGALALGATWTTLGLVAGTFGAGIPLWYRVAAPTVSLAGATMGGLLAVRALSARGRARSLRA